MKKIAYFALGCFWHPQKEFSRIKGVTKTEVGYMGGDLKKFPNPTYKQICNNQTNYAETIKIEFDDKKIKYNSLVEKFWKLHNPTTKNRQGADVGSQYRSIIFYDNDNQKEIAKKSQEELQKNIKEKIVTEIIKAETFFKAEEYHQNYIEKGGVCFS